jgi:acyl-CoA thioester hydrolase
MDTDAAGIWHWTTAMRFAEEAEAALHTDLGIVDLTFGATPRLSVGADFHSPLRFNDLVAVSLEIGRVGRTSVQQLFRIESEAGQLIADGHVTACLVDRGTGRPAAWPDEVRRLLTTDVR